MNGVRLSEIVPGTSRRHIEEFLNDTGLHPETVYYPLLNNDAVVLFKDSTSSAKAMCCNLKKVTRFIVRPLPHKIFARITVYLEDDIAALLASEEEYHECKKKIKDITDKRMKITKQDSGGMTMTGDIYDIELAQVILSDFFERQSSQQHKMVKMVNGHDPAVNQSYESEEKACVARGHRGNTHNDNLHSTAARDNGLEEELTGKGFSLDRMTSIEDDVRGRGSRDLDASKTFNEFTDMSSMHSENISGRVISPETSGISRNQQRDAAAMTSLKSYSHGAERGDRFLEDQLDLSRHRERGNGEEYTSSMFDRNATMLKEMDQIPKKELKDVEAWVYGQKPSRDPKVSPIPSPRTHTNKGISHSGSSPDKVAITEVIQRRQDAVHAASKEKSDDGLQFSFKLHGDVTVKVYYGDIIKSKTDAIVNAANPNLDHHAGVAGALDRACGRDMKRECERYIRSHGILEISQVMHTTAGDLLGTRYIMHTVGPVFIKTMERSCGNRLTCTFLRCLDYAHKNLVIRSVAFPYISTGVFDVPIDICIEAFLDAVVMFFDSYHADTCLKEIHLVNTDVEMVQTAIVMLKQHLEQGVDTLVERALSRLQSRTTVDRSSRLSSKTSPKRRSLSLPRDRNYKTLPGPIDQPTTSSAYSTGEKEKRALPHTPHRERSGSFDLPSSRSSTGARPKSSLVASTTTGRKVASNSKVDVSKTMPSKYSKAIGSTNIEKMKKPQSSQGSNSPKSGPMKATRTTEIDTNSYPYDKEGTDQYSGMTGKGTDHYYGVTGKGTDQYYGLTGKGTDQYYGMTGMDEEHFHSLPADLSRHRNPDPYSYLSADARAPSTEEDDKCSICMDTMKYPKKLRKCGHSFCEDCITQALAVKPVCPMCGKLYGAIKGDQPAGGTMTSRVDTITSLAGYRDAKGMIIIEYKIPSGKQQSCHPNPGTYYSGIQRTAYLPNNREGREVLRLLEKSFDAKLTFTIGYSRTTGHIGVITWNDIHHKTSPTGGSTGYGYPDPDYLKRVKEELALKGITA